MKKKQKRGSKYENRKEEKSKIRINLGRIYNRGGEKENKKECKSTKGRNNLLLPPVSKDNNKFITHSMFASCDVIEKDNLSVFICLYFDSFSTITRGIL